MLREFSTADRVLLRAMQRDASLSVADLAEIAGMSKSACWRRIQRFEEEGVISRRVTLLDPAAVDLSLTVFISIRTNQHNPKWAARFREVIESIPEILEVYRMGGDVDYLLKAVVADMPGYDALYQRLISVELFDVTASFVMEAMKRTTELPI
jgi:Lrp/AsnC family transcriptional regulator